MADLITIRDGVKMIEDAVTVICNTSAVGYNDGALGKLSTIYDILLRNSRFEDEEEIIDEYSFSDILDLNMPAMERARMLHE